MAIDAAQIPQHFALLNLLPETVKFDRIILQFRHALIPLEPMINPTFWDRPRRRTNDFVYTLQYGGFSLLMLGNALMPNFNNEDEFTNQKLHNQKFHDPHSFEAGSPTFAKKLESLRQPLLQLNSLATRHSQKPPIVIVCPMILTFENYALEETNTTLINLAHETNFVPLDLLPIYRTLYRGKYLDPSDVWHPDAEVHASIAQYLAPLLD